MSEKIAEMIKIEIDTRLSSDVYYNIRNYNFI